MHHTRATTAFTVLVAILSLLTACGSDDDPTAPTTEVVVEATLAAQVEAGVPSPILVRAGVRQDGVVSYSAGLSIEMTSTEATISPATGTTDAEGYMSAEFTLDPPAEQATIFVTATDPNTGGEETITVFTVALSALPSRFVGSTFQNLANSSAGSNAGGLDEQFTQDQTEFSAQASSSAESACLTDPGVTADASGASTFTASVVSDAVIEAVRTIEIDGEASISANSNGGTGCSPEQVFATGRFKSEVTVRTFEAAGTLEMSLACASTGSGYVATVAVFEADTLGIGTQKIFDDSFRDTDGTDSKSFTDLVELKAQRQYLIAVEVQVGDRLFGGVGGSFTGSISCQGTLALQRAPSNPR